MKKKQRILVSVDESSHSAELFEFIARNRCFHSQDVTLYHVSLNMPLFLQDAEGAFSTLLSQGELRRFHELKEQEIMEFVTQGKNKLVDAGMDANRIHTKIIDKEVGVARDILAEAVQGYNLVMVGRRGMGSLKEIFLGSVSAKIVEKTSFAPVMVLGAKQPGKTIHVGFDGSDCCMNAVRFVGDVLGNEDYQIILTHILRLDDGERSSRIVELLFTVNWYDKAEKYIREKMEDAASYLVNSGIPREKIEFRVVRDVDTRAGAIVAEADRKGPGIIVMGRRGISRIEQFVMGRVSNKVIQLAKQHTIFIVPERYFSVNG